MIMIALWVWLSGCQPGAEGTPDRESEPGAGAEIPGKAAQASYGMGYDVASNLTEQFAGSLDEDALISGMMDRFGDRPRQVSEQRGQRSMTSLVQKQEEEMQATSTDALTEGNEFLTENGKREGVTTTESGLQYEVLTAVDGPMPAVTDTVTTHYHGTFIDGKIFDSSVDRDQPASFPVNGVISGWTEALQLMGVGSKWRLFIPPGLAYGSQGRPGIPANSTLIFDVELLEINGEG